MDESRRKLVHLMERTWLRGGQEACRELWRGESCGHWELTELSEYFTSSKPKLSIFLKNEYDDVSRASQQRKDEEIAQYAKRVNEQWPEHTEQLKSWANEVWWMSKYSDVAAKVNDPAAARAILKWEKERGTANDLKEAKRRRVKVGQIVDAFPDVDKMHGILQEEWSKDRREIYKLLPDEIRQALRKPSSWQTADGASTGPSPRRRSSTPAHSKSEATETTTGPTMTHAIPRRRNTKPSAANQRSAPTGNTVQPAWHVPIPSRKKRVSTSTGTVVQLTNRTGHFRLPVVLFHIETRLLTVFRKHRRPIQEVRFTATSTVEAPCNRFGASNYPNHASPSSTVYIQQTS